MPEFAVRKANGCARDVTIFTDCGEVRRVEVWGRATPWSAYVANPLGLSVCDKRSTFRGPWISLTQREALTIGEMLIHNGIPPTPATAMTRKITIC